MRRLTIASIVMFVAGVVLLVYTAYSGEGKAWIFFIIPVFESTSPLALAGILLIFLSIFLFFFSLAEPARFEPSQSQAAGPKSTTPGTAPTSAGKKFGGVVFLGPIPIIFGSDKKMAKWMIIVALVLVILLIVLYWYLTTQALQ